MTVYEFGLSSSDGKPIIILVGLKYISFFFVQGLWGACWLVMRPEYRDGVSGLRLTHLEADSEPLDFVLC